MKTTLHNFKNRLLATGLAVVAFVGVQAQCAVNTGITNNSARNITATTTPTIQPGWEAHITVDFGDATSGLTYNGSATSYTGSHQYTTNGTYMVTTSMFSYDPA